MRFEMNSRAKTYIGWGSVYPHYFQDIWDKMSKEKKCKKTFRNWVFTHNNYTGDNITHSARHKQRSKSPTKFICSLSSTSFHQTNSHLPVFTHQFPPACFHPQIFIRQFSPTLFDSPFFTQKVDEDSYTMNKIKMYFHLLGWKRNF